MINKIYEFSLKYNMFQGVNSVIAGISGGADSVCLILVLCELRKRYHLDFKITGVHVNHGIRGEEALRDQKFAEELCRKLDVPFHCYQINVPEMAKEQGMSEEEAGRMARYELFEKAARMEAGNGRSVIAVAHHKNDQAETVLMNLLRGSGIRGLCGIQPIRKQGDQDIIRPLLCVTRDEIESYLASNHQEYITDSTNQDTAYTRNKIRNDLIPYLQEQYNPNVVATICDLAENLSQTEVYLEGLSATLYKSAVTFSSLEDRSVAYIKVSELSHADPVLQGRVVRQAIGQVAGALKDIYRNHIESCLKLCTMQVGRQIDLPYGLRAFRDYDHIVITNDAPKEVRDFCIEVKNDQLQEMTNGALLRIPVMQKVFIPDRGNVFCEFITFEMTDSLEKTLNNVYTKYFDYDKIESNIYLRFKRTGDSIVIHPDGSTKKLKKDLSDRKISKENRDNVLLLTDEEHILWAIGVRRGEDNRIDSESNRILKISVELQED